MDIFVDDVLEMKKQHPCGSKNWQVLRTGMELRLKCMGCGHVILQPRAKIEKNIKNIVRSPKNGET